MRAAFQVVVGGYGNTVTDTFDAAMRHVHALMFPNPEDRKAVGNLEAFPELVSQSLAGNSHQHVRYAIESSSVESVSIVMHDLDAAPGNSTAVAEIDLVDDFDPAYELQAALYKASMTDEALDEIAEELQFDIRHGVNHSRRFIESDQDFVDRLRLYGEWMGGETVIPEAGDATEILKELPARVRQRFEEMAAQAFPDETLAI